MPIRGSGSGGSRGDPAARADAAGVGRDTSEWRAGRGAALGLRESTLACAISAADRAGAARPSILPDSAGYDGQFYYRLALDPWTSVQVEHGVRLDAPAYRQQRIGHPQLVWALALGPHGGVPAVLALWLVMLWRILHFA